MTAQFQLKQQAYSSGLKSRALSILIYLIDRSNKELTCFPSIPTMAEQLHISISTVKRALHELVSCGFIKKDPRFREKNRGQTSNLYTLVMRENYNPAVATTPEPSADDMPISIVEEKKIHEMAEQQKAHAVTYISFADIIGQNSKELEETATYMPPANEAQQPINQPETVCITPKISCSTAIHAHSFLLRFCRMVQNTSPIHKYFSTSIRTLKHSLSKWTGAGVNLLPP